MPLISVVMPVYNCERYLEKAVNSILHQTFKDYELIIIDDCSTDRTSKIIKNLKDNRIRYVKSSKNRGIIASLNNGIELATGNYIARMDGDDISLPTRFEKQIKHLLAMEADICGCHYYTIDSEGRLVTKIDVPLNHNEIIMCLGVVVPFAHPSVMIKKSFLTKNNLRYGDSKYKVAEDLVLWHQMVANNAKFTNVDEYLFKHRQHRGSLTKVKKNKNLIESNKLTKKYIKKDYKVDLSTIRDCSNRTQKLIIRSLLKALIYELDFSYFKNVSKFRLKPLLIGTITGLLGNDLLFKVNKYRY